MFSNICPRTLSVPRSEQFSESAAPNWSLRKTVSFEEQIMCGDNDPGTFSCQMKTRLFKYISQHGRLCENWGASIGYCPLLTRAYSVTWRKNIKGIISLNKTEGRGEDMWSLDRCSPKTKHWGTRYRGQLPIIKVHSKNWKPKRETKIENRLLIAHVNKGKTKPGVDIKTEITGTCKCKNRKSISKWAKPKIKITPN